MIPYAPSRQFSPDSSIIQLIQQAGQNAAQGQRYGGAIWGNAVRDIGGIAAGTIQDIAAGKAHAAEVARKEALDAPRIAAETKKRDLEIQGLERARADADRKAADDASFKSVLSTGTREKVLSSLQGDPERYRQAQEHFGRMDSHMNTMLGEAASAIRAFGDSPEAAMAQLDDLAETGFDPKRIEEMKGQIQQNPANVSALVDSFLLKSPVEAHRAMASSNKKPDSRSLELQLKDALTKGDMATAKAIKDAISQAGAAGRAPVAPKDPVYKEINGQTYEMKNGVAVPVKIQGGVQAATPDEAPFINQPGYAKLSNAAKTAVTSMNNFIQAAEKYRSKLDTLTGPSGILLTGEDAADLDSEHAALLFTAAKAFEQGALQAPDKAVVEQMIPNPAKWSSLLKTATQGGKAGQMRAMNTTIKNFKDRMKSTWGLSATPVSNTQPLENGTTVSAPSRDSGWKPTPVKGFTFREKQ